MAPIFHLFDATTAHEALLGAPVTPADSATRVATLAGTWIQPARGLDDEVTWAIAPTGELAVHRKNKQGKSEEPVRQLTVARDRLLALRLGSGTQYVPMFRSGDTLYLSWTSGAIAVPVTDPAKLVLDLADAGRWLVVDAKGCTILDPMHGASAATCAWDGEGSARRAFTVKGDGLEQRWPLVDGMLVHPRMDAFTRRQGK